MKRCSSSSTPPPPPLIILVLSLLSTRYNKCISKEGVEGWKFAMKRCSSSSTSSPHPLIVLILSLPLIPLLDPHGSLCLTSVS